MPAVPQDESTPPKNKSTPVIPPSSESAPSAPIHVPDHQLLRCIGRGAYGEVWLARSIMGTFRAVKIVYRRSFEHERPYEREFNGIKKFEPISRSHEGLVDILQVGRNDEEGYFYYVMEVADDESTGQNIDPEHYEPRTLRNAIAAQPRVSFSQCVDWALALTAAVGHLHQSGLIHRDIKPANIVFVNGALKLADIGLVTDAGSNTIPGGTIGYIAPEAEPTPRADLYSLGKVLYELLTGKDRCEFPELPTLWGDETGPDEAPKLLEMNEVVLKACESDPRKRYQSADELRADLVLLQSGKSVKRLRLLERRLSLLTRVGVVAAVVALIVAGAAFVVYRQNVTTTRQLARSYIAYGTRSMEEGDLLGSLPWFAQALKLHGSDPTRAPTDRTRIATVLRESPRLLRMWFQDGIINDVRGSPDGRFVFTGSNRGLAALWSLESDEPVLRLTNHAKGVENVRFSRDGRRLLTGGGDGTLRLWDATTGRELAQLSNSTAVTCSGFSPDDKHILAAGWDGYVRVWDAASLELIKEFRTDSRPSSKAVRHAAFSPDGTRIVTGSQDGTAQIWTWADGKKVGATMSHGDGVWVLSAEFSPDGRFVATAGWDKTARLWDATTGALLWTIPHRSPVRTVAFSPDSRYLVISANDFAARIWDVDNRKEALPPLKHNSYVLHAAFSADGSRVVTSTTSGILCLWDLTGTRWTPPPASAYFAGQENPGARSNASSVVPVEVKANRAGTRLLTLSPIPTGRSSTVTARLWDATGKPLSSAFVLSNATPGAKISDDGRCVANPVAKAVDVWDIARGRLRNTLILDSSKNDVFPHPKGDLVLVVTRDALTNQARLWDSSGRRATVQLPHPPAKVLSAAFDVSGSRLVTVCGTNAFIWDVETANRLTTLDHSVTPEWADFSPDGARVITCSSDFSLAEQEARIWDAHTGRQVGAPLRHRDGVKYGAFSPDNKWVVTSSEDFTAQVWSADTGRESSQLLRHPGHQVTQARFSPDGLWVVTSGGSDGARAWEARTGEPITTTFKTPWNAASAQFLGDGRLVLLKNALGPSILWPLPPDERPIDDLIALSQLYSGHHIDPNSGALPLAREKIRSLWQELRTRHPAQFDVNPADLLRWHETEAGTSERKNLSFPWRFHLDRLVALRPDNTNLASRRDRLTRASVTNIAERGKTVP